MQIKVEILKLGYYSVLNKTRISDFSLLHFVFYLFADTNIIIFCFVNDEKLYPLLQFAPKTS